LKLFCARPKVNGVKGSGILEDDRPGCYTLVISLRKKKRIRIGSLGASDFPQGIYLYTGSAKNGLRSRLSHHLGKRAKRNHWHIDYLLQCPEARVKYVLIYPPTRQECALNRQIARLAGAEAIFKGFGASDCVFGCPAHLYYFRKKSPQRVEGEKTKSSLAFPLAGTFIWACCFPSFSCQTEIL